MQKASTGITKSKQSTSFYGLPGKGSEKGTGLLNLQMNSTKGNQLGSTTINFEQNNVNASSSGGHRFQSLSPVAKPSAFMKTMFNERSTGNVAASDLSNLNINSFPASLNSSLNAHDQLERQFPSEKKIFASQRQLQVAGDFAMQNGGGGSLNSTHSRILIDKSGDALATAHITMHSRRNSGYSFSTKNPNLPLLAKQLSELRGSLLSSLNKDMLCDKSTIINLITLFECFHLDLENKYAILPAAEHSTFKQFLDIEGEFLTHIRNLKSEYKQFSQMQEKKDYEINRLIESVNELLKKIATIEGTISSDVFQNEIEKLTASMQEQCSRFQEINETKEKQLMTTQLTTMSLKAANSKLERENAAYESRLQQCLESIQQLNASNHLLEFQWNNCRERLFMLQEDMAVKQMRMNDLREQYRKSQVFLKKLQEKMDRIELDKSIYVNPPEKADFDEEVKFFESVRAIYKNHPILAKRIKADYVELISSQTDIERKVMSMDERPKVYQNQISTNISSQDPNFNINHYRYYKFSYFSLISDKYDAILRENREIYKTRKVTNIFIGTLRAILDSKWNEALTIDDPISFTHLGDFTYGWLRAFVLDKVSRKIVVNSEFTGTSTSDMASREESQAFFFIDLQNPILNKIWEVLTFREFLSADSSGDELYFYLHCRNLLFKGAQLEYMEATFQPIHYVRYAHARVVIESVMCRYDSSNIEFMIGVIFKRCLKKNNNYIIDSGLVLRLLLEYYRAERVHRFRLIKQLFFSQNGTEVNGVHSLPFSSFSKIFIDNYKGTSFAEQAQMYRDCMTLGNGQVTSEIFFVVGTERNFFMKHLRLKLLNEIPEYDRNTNRLEPSLDFRTKMLAGFFEECRSKLSSFMPQLLMSSCALGLETNLVHAKEFLAYIESNRNFKLESTEMGGKNLPLYFSNFVAKITQAADIQLYTLCEVAACGPNHLEIEFMEAIFKRLETQMNTVAQIVETKKRKEETSRLSKLKTVQVWMKKKISRWYNILNIMLLAKLADSLKQEQLANQY